MNKKSTHLDITRARTMKENGYEWPKISNLCHDHYCHLGSVYSPVLNGEQYWMTHKKSGQLPKSNHFLLRPHPTAPKNFTEAHLKLSELSYVQTVEPKTCPNR